MVGISSWPPATPVERGDGADRRACEHPGDGLRRTVEVGGLDVAQMGAQEGHGDKHEQDGQDPVQGARDHLGGQVAPRCAPTRLLVSRLTTIIQCGASAAAGTATSRAGRAVASRSGSVPCDDDGLQARNPNTPISKGRRNSAPRRPITQPRSPTPAPATDATSHRRFSEPPEPNTGASAAVTPPVLPGCPPQPA